MVVVSLNYRLGALGFFAHDALESSVANFGLTDAMAALSWVRNNIPAFGGDPNNITIFGNSAGGMMVNLLLASDPEQARFDKAISQSGYITWPIPTTRAMRERRVMDIDGMAVPFAEDLGEAIVTSFLSGQPDRQELRELDASKLVNSKTGFFRPIVDGVTLKDQPYRLIEQKSYFVPLLTGGTSYEGSVMPFSGISMNDYRRSWCSQRDFLQEFYQQDFEADPELGYRRAFGDERYVFSAYYLSQQWRRKNQTAWLYLIDLPHARDPMGTPHGVDYQLLFQTESLTDKASREASARMRNYWVNFARTGDPNGEPLPTWPLYDSGPPKWLVIGDNPASRPFNATLMDLLQRRLLERQKQATFQCD